MAKIKNILFITTDQQRRDSLPCYELDFMKTPAIDTLAQNGLVFDNCYSVSPVCQPARGAFITGQYPYVNNIPDNFHWITPDSPTIARIFNEAGWNTAAIGKMHFHPWNNREGFKYRIIAEDKRHYFRRDDYTLFLEKNGYSRDHPASLPGYRENLGAPVSPLPEDFHIDTFIGDETVKWIEHNAKEPFFLWASFNSPHDPYDPPEKMASMYKGAPIPPPVGDASELQNKPTYQRRIIDFYKKNLLYLTDYSRMTNSDIIKIREHYFATVTLIDRQVAKIIESLRKRKFLDTTLIVFSSDHGDNLGDHGLPFKSNFYEGALMVPLIISGPGIPAGKRVKYPVNWLDLHRTFLSITGIEEPDHLQGENIEGLIFNDEDREKRDQFSELLGSVMIKSGSYKLVLCDNGEGELYDLSEEPLEVHNHFNEAAYRDIREELTSRIIKHLLDNNKVHSFGGGRYASDAERARCFESIRAKLKKGEL